MNHSTLYPFALFLHVVGVMALVAFYGMEWATLLRLRRSPEPRHVTEALASLGAGRGLIPLGSTLLFVPGAYLAWVGKVEKTPWVAVGLLAMIVLGFLGGSVTGKRVQAIMASEGRALATHLPALWNSLVVRASVLIAAIFVMCAKPGIAGSVTAAAIAFGGGLLIARTTSPRPAEAAVSGDTA
nr:MAG: hypothetical protein DIU72_11840 [Pseudomonadota bacterium]